MYMDGKCLQNYVLAFLNGLKKHLNLMKIVIKSYNEDSERR